MCKCDWENCSIRKQICEETQKAIDEGKEPKGFCPQCPDCEGNCRSEDISLLKKLFKYIVRG